MLWYLNGVNIHRGIKSRVMDMVCVCVQDSYLRGGDQFRI